MNRGGMPNDPSSIRACWALYWAALAALVCAYACAHRQPPPVRAPAPAYGHKLM